MILGLGLCGVLTSSGCYERVVKSSGLGGATTQPPYRSNTLLDRAYDGVAGSGTQEKTFRGADNMPVTGKSRWTSEVTGGGVQRHQ